MTRDERLYALRVAIYDAIGYHLGIDDSDDGACDAKNAAAIDVLRLIERELADAVDLSGKIEAAWEWIARVEPHPELNGGLLSGLRAALSGRPDRCDRCHRPLPHSEAESRACVPDVPAARDEPEPERPRRYDQCDETCTADCGHCKGAGVQVTTPEGKR